MFLNPQAIVDILTCILDYPGRFLLLLPLLSAVSPEVKIRRRIERLLKYYDYNSKLFGCSLPSLSLSPLSFAACVSSSLSSLL